MMTKIKDRIVSKEVYNPAESLQPWTSATPRTSLTCCWCFGLLRVVVVVIVVVAVVVVMALELIG